MSTPTPPVDEPVVVSYERQGEAIRLTLTNLTNHELRSVITGLWLRLNNADRADHLAELHHYLTGKGQASPVSNAIWRGGEGEPNTINLAGLQRRYREHPG